MGTQTTSQPTPDAYGNQAGSGQWNDNGSYSFPENGWVDRIHFYAGGNGSTQNFIAGFYANSTGGLVASTVSGGFFGKAWKSLAFNLPSNGNNYSGGYNSPYLYVWSGYVWSVGFWCDGNADVGINLNVNGFYYTGGGSGPAGNRVHGSLNPFGNHGELYYYLEYFPALASVSVTTSSPVAVGQNFTVSGNSFTAGINSDGIVIHGSAGDVSCPTYTVNSDTQVTVTVPSGATSGAVTVNTNAGSATSSNSVTVSGGSIARSGVWSPSQEVGIARSGAWNVAQGSYIARSGAWNPAQ